MIKSEDFKIAQAATILKAKGFEILEQEETYIKIKNKDNSPLYIDLDPAKKYLFLNIKVLLKKGTSKEKIDGLISQIIYD